MIRPLADRVLIEPHKADEKTKGGIIIPNQKERKSQGTVIAVGPGTSKITMTVQKDDVVIYGQYAGTEVEVKGRKLLLIRQSDIFAVV